MPESISDNAQSVLHTCTSSNLENATVRGRTIFKSQNKQHRHPENKT